MKQTAKRDEEQGLIGKKREWLGDYEEAPVGGHAGCAAFHDNWQLALRCAMNGCILASTIWIPATRPYVNQGITIYVPTAILMIFFNIAKVFGVVVNNVTGVIVGVFCAFLNIFILRGFFPDGVTPGMGTFAPAVICGWLDLMIFDMFFLAADVRPSVRTFALAGNTNFLLMFLNPNDQTPFSGNFKLNVKGMAFQSLYVAFAACMLTLMAHLLPFPMYFAKGDMKDNAVKASAYVAKCFIGAVNYYNGEKPSVAIERQMTSTGIVAAQVGSLGGSIGGAWWEGFDIGTNGVIRKLHEQHQGMLGQLVDITKAVENAISTEDFAESHKIIMKAIGEACYAVVDTAGELLMTATHCAGDGDIDKNEKEKLDQEITACKDAMKDLAVKFDTVRRDWTPLNKELMSESFFVFAISKYARLVVEYSEKMRDDPPQGVAVCSVLMTGFASTFTCANVPEGHTRIAIRTWIGLMACFLYGVHFDSYGGACAVTAVFLSSQRTSPDIQATLKVLLAVTIASCVGAIIYFRACQVEQFTGPWVLPLLSFFFWFGCLYVGFAGGTFALIGMLCGALSAFVLVSRCPEVVVPGAAAVGMWIGIRGFIIALFIMSVCEVCSMKGALTSIAVDGVKTALESIENGLTMAWDKQKDPSDELAGVGGAIANANAYGLAAEDEPRFWRANWNYELIKDVAHQMELLDLDVKLMFAAMRGADGKVEGVFKVLKKVEECDSMKDDFIDTLRNARELSVALLKHEYGEFPSAGKLEELEGVDSLDGFDDAIKHMNESKALEFPETVADSIEDDLCVQISIVFVMLQTGIGHVANIIKATIRNS